MNRITKRLALPVVAAAVLGTSGYAFMASNSQPTSFAGQGLSTVAGYNVSNIHYDLVTDMGHNGDLATSSIQYVEFTLDHPAKTVGAKVNDTNYNLCFNTNGDAVNWKCEPQNAGHGTYTKDANSLVVLAAQ
ncbi:MAG: hypothetical protein ACTHJH_13330 [Marmoricola sp.]